MELLQLDLFGIFSTGYLLNSKINIESNNEPFAIFCNTLHLILNVSSISCNFIIFKMKQNTYLNNVFQLYDMMNSTYLSICYKTKQILYG